MGTVIDQKVDKLERVFETENILEGEVAETEIREYYRQDSLLYRLFLGPVQRYLWNGYIHNGISRNGEFSKDDLNEAPRIVSGYIEEFDCPNVLELGMGKGANLVFLAEKCRPASFYGIDLLAENVSNAERKLKDKDDCTVEQGDFHNLERYERNQFSVVFAVEALCYSKDIEKVFSEVKRVLEPGGYFVVFDHYLLENREELSENELKAQNLLETIFTVDSFEYYPEFKQKGTGSGFKVASEENLSEEILPTAQRFGFFYDGFYNHSYLAYPLTKILPKETFYNSISAYLMKDLIKERIDGYYLTLFQR